MKNKLIPITFILIGITLIILTFSTIQDKLSIIELEKRIETMEVRK
jgi:hypothetical protein